MLWEAGNILNILTCNAPNKYTVSENGHTAQFGLITKSASFIIRQLSLVLVDPEDLGFKVLVVSAENCEVLFIVGSHHGIARPEDADGGDLV
jgi:hypothetical protein